ELGIETGPNEMYDCYCLRHTFIRRKLYAEFEPCAVVIRSEIAMLSERVDCRRELLKVGALMRDPGKAFGKTRVNAAEKDGDGRKPSHHCKSARLDQFAEGKNKS